MREGRAHGRRVTVRVAIAGLSNYAVTTYVPYLLSNSETEIVGFFDPGVDERSRQRIAEFRATTGLSSVADLESLVTTERADCLIVSSPHQHHYSQALTALRSGCHVLLDKPAACNHADASRLVEIAEERGLAVAVANQRRFEPPYRHIWEVLESNRLGAVRAVNYLFASSPWRNYSETWRADTDLNCGGVLMDIGYLALDTLVWLIGPKDLVVDSARECRRPGHSDWTVSLLVGFATGMASITVTYLAPGRSVQEELSIYCDAGAIFARRLEDVRAGLAPTVSWIDARGDAGHMVFPPERFGTAPLEAFLTSVATGADSPASVKRALETTRLIERSYIHLEASRRFAGDVRTS